MRYNKYRVKTLSSAEDIVSSTIMEAGVEGVEIEDKLPLTEEEQHLMFGDVVPKQPEDDGLAYISFYLNEEDPHREEVLERVRRELQDLAEFLDIGEGTIEETKTDDKDWLNSWKEFFHQFYVDDILVIPSWEQESRQEKQDGTIVLHIDPGSAFGTGMHESTQLVMRQLKTYVTEDTNFLDVGTGSGILSILALKLGARHALGTDLDPNAAEAVRENLAANEIPPGKMEMVIGNLIDDPEIKRLVGEDRYDLVAANILAEILLPLTPAVVPCMKKGGIYITSGILEEKEQMVTDAMCAAGLKVLNITHQEEWVSVTAKKV